MKCRVIVFFLLFVSIYTYGEKVVAPGGSTGYSLTPGFIGSESFSNFFPAGNTITCYLKNNSRRTQVTASIYIDPNDEGGGVQTVVNLRPGESFNRSFIYDDQPPPVNWGVLVTASFNVVPYDSQVECNALFTWPSYTYEI